MKECVLQTTVSGILSHFIEHREKQTSGNKLHAYLVTMCLNLVTVKHFHSVFKPFLHFDEVRNVFTSISDHYN